MHVITPQTQNDRLTLASCPLGQGLRARNLIRSGEVCGYLSGQLIRFEESTTEVGSNSVQIGPDLYVMPSFPLLYANHSCEPNAGLCNDLSLIAIKDITLGEELLIDYSTTMYERHYTMQCICGASSCRSVIRDFDLLPVDLQLSYLEQGIVQSFIADKVWAHLNKSSSGLVQAIQDECGEPVGLAGLK